MAWCRTALWICLLAVVYKRCCSSLTSFSNSLSLTRNVRSRVQQLLLRYKEDHFGDTNFDDKRIVLNTLPSVNINYWTWLQMEDAERLYHASRDLQSFWTHLESQRQKLQESGDVAGKIGMKRRNRRGRPYPSLSKSILGIQLDLRDLMRQANSQLNGLSALKKPPPLTTTSATSRPSATSSSTSSVSPSGSTRSALALIVPSAVRATSLPPPREGEASPGTMQQKSVSSRWVSVLEGYVILRDLERYLSRLARDYTLLRAKS